MNTAPKRWDKVSWDEPDNYCTYMIKNGFVKNIFVEVIDRDNPNAVCKVSLSDLKKGWLKK